jgi:hypothetical protein
MGLSEARGQVLVGHDQTVGAGSDPIGRKCMKVSEVAKRSHVARKAFWRRLARQAALGAAGAVGSGFVSLLLWWLHDYWTA